MITLIHFRTVLFGFLAILPFFILNTLIATRYEPILSLLRPDGHTSIFEQVLLFSTLLLMLMGGIVALSPNVQMSEDGKRHLYPLNIAIGAMLIIVAVVLIYAFGTEVYRCDVLGIPNCD